MAKTLQNKGVGDPAGLGFYKLEPEGLGSYPLYLKVSLPLLHALKQGLRAPALLMANGLDLKLRALSAFVPEGVRALSFSV